MGVEIRTITEDEVRAYRDALMQTFGDDHESDPDGPDRMRKLIDLARVWAAFDGGAIVATAGTFDLTVVVPGGRTLPMAGLTMVSVRPTHRRRGLLRALMARHLDDAHDRGIAISGLWASEASIYGRFGYGIASESEAIEIAGAGMLEIAEGRPVDDLEWLDEARARELFPAIYARAIAQRPGALVRSDVWWRERPFLESPWARGGASRKRHVIARRGGEAVGYLQFRQRAGFTAHLPTGKVEIAELFALDARAEATLWRFACRVDLAPTVTYGNTPVDSAIAWLASDPRRVVRRRVDNLWLRIDDVAAALAGRGYTSDGALRLAIDDGPAWELVVEAGAPRCAPTPRAPELRLSRQALGALYLGGAPASRLARADLVTGDAAALATADRLFSSPVAPWCPEIF